MLDPLFFLISRLNNACSPLVINLQINLAIGIKDIPFLSFQLWTFNFESNLTKFIKSQVVHLVHARVWT